MYHIAMADPEEYDTAPSFWDVTERCVRYVVTITVSLCDTHMLTVILRCGSHVIHLAAKHFLAAINPKPHRGRQAMADHDDSNDTDMDSDTEHDPSEEDPSWEPGDLLGKALAFVTQVRRL